jgi:hypothetical protein
VGAFIEPAGYEPLAYWLFNSDLYLLLSLSFRGYISPKETSKMIKNSTGMKGGPRGLLLRIILEFAWSDRQTAITLTSYGRQPNRLWVAGVDGLHINALYSVADSTHSRFWRMLHIRRFSFQISGVFCSFRLSDSLKKEMRRRRRVRDTALLKT